ncbi:MAG: SMP-30/gluconolactonase/LRE family protein [Burkholderiales bacterium]
MLNHLALWGTFATLAFFSANAASAEPRIIRLDPRFDQLLSRDAKVEKIADGFTWVEGPVWNKREGYLLLSDIPNNSVYKWRRGKGVSVFMHPSGYTGSAPFEGREPGANGLTFDREGRLILAEHGDRRLARLEPDGSKTTLASHYEGKRLNSPNDVVFKSNGDLYFTDPPFGLPKAFDDPAKELPHQGVYRLKPDGEIALLIDDLKAPNGIAFSPDENTLYVTDVAAGRWLAYPVDDDGTLGAGKVFADANPFRKNGKGGADGLKVDARGNLFATGPGGLYVFAPDATLLGRIDFGVPAGNVAWGEDGSVLYITANTGVYRIETRTRGASF